MDELAEQDTNTFTIISVMQKEVGSGLVIFDPMDLFSIVPRVVTIKGAFMFPERYFFRYNVRSDI